MVNAVATAISTQGVPSSSRPVRESTRERRARIEQRILILEHMLTAEREQVRNQAMAEVSTNLPPPDVLAHLVEVFFARVPGAELIVDRDAIVHGLNLPCRDNHDYPATSILHAICAVTSLFAEGVLLYPPSTNRTYGRASQGYQDVATGAPRSPETYGSSFGEQHARFAHAAVEAAQPGTSTFESLQANILLSWFYFALDYSSRALCASAESLRTSTLLGLTRSGTHQPILACAATLPLGTSNGHAEVDIEGQRRVWWLAYATDRWQGANTPWPSMLDDEDVTQLLPLPLNHTTATPIPPGSRQQISTPGMFTSHIADQTDSFVLFVKAAILLSIVKTFLLRWDAPYRHSPDGRPDARSTAPFQDIDNLLVEFDASVRNFQFVGAHGVDQYMLLVRAAPYVATILFHEQYVQPNDLNCLSTTRMVGSARQIWVLVQELSSTQIALMDPIFSVALAVACRVFLRIIEVKLSQGRLDEACMFKPEAELLRLGLQSMSTRYPLAVKEASTLDNIIRNRLGRRYERIGQSFVTSHLQESIP